MLVFGWGPGRQAAQLYFLLSRFSMPLPPYTRPSAEVDSESAFFSLAYLICGYDY